uniref:Killer cell immunoglobulin like receptor, three Ig domains and long cytoplasmic tail 3 n=1 Tax=Microcebus murinus TaxID=30608 RepID=A0A8C5XEQ2_MICMU|nr:killer cell immunoglobulin-like receptor 3DL3 isoform X1 [Microcebus murinus]
MSSNLMPLLCLGFYLGHRTFTHMGGHNQPSLSASPSPVVPLGGHVTLRCYSHLSFVIVKLSKRVGSNISEIYSVLSHNTFAFNPVTTAHAGTYRCSVSYTQNPSVWSALSEPLEIMVTGVFRKPSISAFPSSLVHTGSSVTLSCLSELDFDKFILHKDGTTQHSQLPAKRVHAELPYTQADFSIDTMMPTHAGTYRCYGSLSHSPCQWSAPSDPLDVVITGQYEKPSLSTHVGPTMGSGENMTLSCSSKTRFDKYHLSREGEAHDRWLSERQSHNGTFQVYLPLGSETPSHGGTYRCYGYFYFSPHKWSSPSDPLHLSVTGTPKSTCLSPIESTSKSKAGPPPGQFHKQDILIGLSGVIISIGIFLSVLLGYWCSTKNHPAIMDTEPMEVQIMERNDPAAEETQEIVYAQLNQHALTRREFSLTSQCSRYRLDEPSTWVDLHTCHVDHAEARPDPGL